jgi:hypothetical protein
MDAPPDAREGADAPAAAFGLRRPKPRWSPACLPGRTLDGITRPTAKTHLEHIFLKTGATRQTEQMRLRTGLISPTGSTM